MAIWLFVGAIENQIIAIGGLRSCCRGLNCSLKVSGGFKGATGGCNGLMEADEG